MREDKMKEMWKQKFFISLVLASCCTIFRACVLVRLVGCAALKTAKRVNTVFTFTEIMRDPQIKKINK